MLWNKPIKVLNHCVSMNSYNLEHLVGVFLLNKVLHFFQTTTGIEPSIFSFQKISALLVLCIFLKLCFACMF